MALSSSLISIASTDEQMVTLQACTAAISTIHDLRLTSNLRFAAPVAFLIQAHA